MSAGGSTRAIIAACLANLGIAAAKLLGFFFTRSSSTHPSTSIGAVLDARGPRTGGVERA